MLGRNNFAEKSRKFNSRSTRERFSIRKLSVGAASVLLGVTFLGLSSQSAKADTITTPADNTQQVVKAPKKDNLSTYKGLSSFLRDDKTSKTDKTNQESTTTATDTTSTTPATTDDSAAKTPEVATPAQAAASTPATTDDSKDGSVTINQGDTNVAQPAAIQTKDEINPKIPGAVAKVSTWNEFTAALANAGVGEIDLENNIKAPTTGRNDVYFKRRQVLIQSDPATVGKDEKGNYKHFILDYCYYSPRTTNDGVKGTTDVTYRNLDIYSRNWFGIDNTRDNNPGTNKLTVENVNFTGSEMFYTGDGTSIYIKGTVNAQAVKQYQSPIDLQTYSCDDRQQLFQFNDPNQAVYFTKDSTFVGSTDEGCVMEFDGSNSSVTIDSGASVTLNPCSIDGGSGDHSEGIGKASAITFNNGDGTITVNKRGNLTINVGTSSFNGTPDSHRAAAITMASRTKNGAKLIDNGTITINTNGDITSSTGGGSKANTLVYDQGSMQIGPGGALNIYGKNMQNFAGNLLYITGSADLNNGSLDIELQNDASHPNGAGTGKIILVDVSTTGTLTVNNPKSLILNAHDNSGNGTSIIGDSEIDIKNVRQVFHFANLPQITLPPFHILNVKKRTITSGPMKGQQTIGVNKIEVLNGKNGISEPSYNALVAALQSGDPKQSKILDVLQQAFGQPDHQATMDKLKYYYDNGTHFDDIFQTVIENAFSSKDNVGYNSIYLVSPNQGGFLDIEDDDGIPGQASYHQNADGSITLSGKVENFNADTDGPKQPNNLFSMLMTCGMYPYVKIVNKRTGKIYANGSVADPYVDTNDLDTDLHHDFSVIAGPDGKFSITIPIGEDASGAKETVSGDEIDLIPEANFIGFDPEITGKTVKAYVGNIMGIEQIRAFTDKELDNGLENAIARIQASGLTKDKQQPYIDKIQKEHDDACYYIDKATVYSDIKHYRDQAIDMFNHEAAKSELAGYGDKCIADLKLTDGDEVYKQIISNVTQGSSYIDTKDGCVGAEHKLDSTPTNQARDIYENQLLSISKTWLSNLLEEQGVSAKAELDKHSELENIADLKAQIDQITASMQRSVTSASNSKDAYIAYTDGKKQLDSFVTSQLSGVLQQEAIQNVRNKWTSSRAALMKLKNLPIAKQVAYRSQLNSVMSTALAKIKTATGVDITQAYNDFVKSADDIVKAATDENNK
ncbi:YSIRK-type signal peptide-containing protein [Lactobacillus sp. ESL0731]|uniref:pectate lyase-like adhesive domain-containing protein n=1 Tax=unclassified Lactobacillus TaxID=2620435 RepID=UPI0023FA312E|nr:MULTISPECIES: pectate lyase-like adhesive domain-containing protein [unclassified Lactobacillus]WEV51823.1 YSIRK-type signal peptide-containing protein [Lactobacillus sp. ESL0700]WEV62952.1 YSIRK-type signal peptide-containing protein [Lactobacillus sp. ESL0731]